MEYANASFTIFPSVVVADQKTTVSISPHGSHARFDDNFKSVPPDQIMTPRLPYGYKNKNEDITYTIYIVPMEHSNHYAPISSYDKITTRPCNGGLVFDYTFSDEQKYTLVIMDPYNEEHELISLNIYCIQPDLCNKYPFKGDLHVHSYFSDGHESPEIVAANYRRHGFDFMTLTDHCKRFPSEYLVDFYRDIPIDMEIYHGEEIHVPFPFYIHAISINGNSSVNEYYVDHSELCDAECTELAKTLNLPDNADAIDISKRVWIAREINKRGGLSILVHPHWIYENVYNMRDSSTQYLLKNNIYDAFELLGGMSIQENNIQTALYSQLRAEGVTIPIVGSSDSHGTEPPVYFDELFTLVFAEDTSFENISKAIKNQSSVAVQILPNDNYQVYGEYRLVKYARFLMDNYFPKHNELCIEQGRLMKEFACGASDALSQLKSISGRTKQFAKKFFGF